ncbi:MAG: 2Fe-2S iron-sulfur cluster-binding protein [Bacteroidales bacterium]
MINNKKTIIVRRGSSLLYTLAQNNIYLPSSCGGGGSCKRCKCVVKKGGGNHSFVEDGVFTPQELKNHNRLACQVIVKKNMEIYIAENILESMHEKVN